MRFFVAALAILLGLLPTAGFGASTDVRRELDEICRTATNTDARYYGHLESRTLERRLRNFGGDPAERVDVENRLGWELLKLGRLDEAIATLSAGLSTAKESGLPTELQADLLSSLVLAHLQAAEDANCLMNPTGGSCTLPIRPEAVHRLREHTRKAGDVALELLRLRPESAEILWILNIARMLSGDFPAGVPPELRLPEDTFRSAVEFPRWHSRAAELGVDSLDLAGGAIMDDFDGDGLLDLVESTWDHCGSLKAFRNDGRGGFEDVSAAWGLDEQLGGLNVVQGDYDNDGRLDLLVLRGGWLYDEGRIRNSLLHNTSTENGPRFVDVTRQAGLAEPAYPTQTAGWADFDLDGDLDLYVGNESSRQRAYPSQLFLNRGDGTFVDIAERAGVRNLRFVKSVGWGDYDNDGDPDLAVSNWALNRLYRNDGDGTFTDVAEELGVLGPEGWTFPTWFFDYDNDGDLDLFVGDFNPKTAQIAASYFGSASTEGHPILYRNDGARFTDVSLALGLTRPAMPMGANYGDLDNDGWLDFYLGTGDPSFQSLVPNVMMRNVGGKRFEDVSFAGGFAHLQKGHGVAFGDLDNDGDQDLFHQLGGFYPVDEFTNALFENPGNEASWLTLRLRGTKANRFGVGARIAVRVREGKTRRTIHLLAGSGGSFGGSSLQQEVGLGRAEVVEEIAIRWPGSEGVQRFGPVEPNRVYLAVEGERELRPIELPRIHLGATGKPAAKDHPHAHGG